VAASHGASRAATVASELAEVIELATVDHDVVTVGRMHRLRAGRREVDHGEPAVSGAHTGFHFTPGVGAIRAAVGSVPAMARAKVARPQ
jgi:hypothetical protein